MNSNSWLRCCLILGFWTLLSVFFASQAYLYQAGIGHPVSWSVALSYAVSRWYAWAALTPPIFYWARRFRIERNHWVGPALLHLVAATLIAPLQVVIEAVFRLGLFGLFGASPFDATELLSQIRTYLIGRSFDNLLTYGTIVAVCYMIDYYRKYRERELRASQLEAQLTQAELSGLKMQLQPHFLFNTLHSIAALMHKDIPAAERMITRLGDLLRLSLQRAGQEDIALKEELEFLEGYLEIEQTRFRDRLSVHFEIDPRTLACRVPNLILQPLVENAIRHGIAPRGGPGRVEIRAFRRNGLLQLQVHDNGPGLPRGTKRWLHSGVGLSNTRARLQQLYGPRHRFELKNIAQGGLLVTLAFPLCTSDPFAESVLKQAL